MIEIAGRCIIDHQIAWLAEAGVTDVVVSAGHLHEVLIEHLSAGSQPVRVATVVEDEPLGRGGGLKYAGKYLYWRAIDTAKDIREATKELGASGR